MVEEQVVSEDSDKLNPKVLDTEFHDVKKESLGATRILDGFQVSGNLIFEWKWLKISPT